MIQVTGTLLDPLGRPIPEAVIRLTAEVSAGNTPEASFSLYETDSNGFYDFNVENGRYTLEVNSSDEFTLTATVIADTSTPTPIDLVGWANYATPITPPVIVPGTPDWVNLHDALRTDVDTTQRKKIDQLSDGDVYVNESKELIENDRIDAQMSQNTVETHGGSSKVDQQTNVYTDGSNNESIQITTKAEAGNGSIYDRNELYKASDGSVITHKSTNVTINEGHADYTCDIDSTELGSTTEYAHTDALVSLVASAHAASGTHRISSNVGGREAFHEVHSEGVSSRITSSANNVVIEDEAGNTVIDVDTETNTVTMNARLVVGNPDDFKGDAGDTIFEVFQYSQDNNVTDPWHDTFDPSVDFWRRQNTSVNGYVDPSNWSIGMLLIAEDGLPGDTLYVDYKYSNVDSLPDPNVPDPLVWHDDLAAGDTYRIECQVNNGVHQLPWSNPARIRGLDGADGNIVELEYSYSTDGVTGASWHYNFVTGDHFRRERYIFFHTQAERDAYVPVTNETFFQATPWNNVAQIVPINGVDYGVKQTVVYLFQKGATEPPPPSGVLTYHFDTLTVTPTANLNGWETSIPAGNGNIYVAIAVASALGVDSDPIGPTEWNISQWSEAAYNQANITLYKRVPITDPDPIPPTTVLTYDFATRTFVPPYDLQGWSELIPAGSDPLWQALASASATTPTDTIQPTEWQLTDSGATGLNQANMVIYQRAPTQPAAPTANATYDFTTGVLTGLTGGWQNTITNGTDPLWVGLATAISFDVTDVIPPAEWNISKLAEDGKTVATSNLFCVSATIPAVAFTQCNQTLADGSITIIGSNTEGWTNEPPTNTAPGGKVWHITNAQLVLSGTTVAYHDAADYSAPVVLSQNGLDGSDGIDGYNTATVVLYKRGTPAAPATPSGTLTYDFSSGALTGATDGWSINPPTGGTGYIYATAATVLSQSTTDTIAPSEWVTPVQWEGTRGTDGTNGTDGINGLDGSYVSFIYKNTTTVTAPTKPTLTEGSYDGTTEVIPTGWTDNPAFVDGEITWQCTRRYVDNRTSWNPNGEWSPPSEFASQGKFSETRYKIEVIGTTPTAPANVPEPTGWTITAPANESGKVIWASSCTKQPTGELATNWSTPVRWQGTDGTDGTNGIDGRDGISVSPVFIYITNSGGTPTLPTNSVTYDFTTGLMTPAPNNGWSQDIPTTAGYTWITTATALGTVTALNDTIAPSEWAAPTLLSKNGENGKHGSGSFVVIVPSVASIPIDSGKDTDVANLAGRPAQEGDIVTYQDNAKTFVKQFLRGASTWSEFSIAVDGDVIVNGTIAGEKIIAESITGDRFNATSTLKVGTGNNSATLSGSDSVGRIWAGNERRDYAPFQVHQNGHLYANNADIQGVIRADQLIMTGGTGAVPPEIASLDNILEQGNLIDLSDWRVGNTLDSITDLNIYGGNCSASIQSVSGIRGGSVNALKTNSYGASSTWHGGFHTNLPTSRLDHNKSYRVRCWVRQTRASTGNWYFGFDTSGEVLNMDGSVNTNPYVVPGWTGYQANKWYLFVGVIHGKHVPSTGSTGIGGLYDPSTGRKVYSGADFRAASHATNIFLRMGNAYGNSGTEMHFYQPAYEALDSAVEEVRSFLAEIPGDAQDKANNARDSAQSWADSYVISNGKSRGTLYPSQHGSAVYSSDYSSGSRGWAIFNNGNCEFNNGTFRGRLEANDGYFNGTVQANKVSGAISANKAVWHSARAVVGSGAWHNLTSVYVRGNSLNMSVTMLPVKLWYQDYDTLIKFRLRSSRGNSIETGYIAGGSDVTYGVSSPALSLNVGTSAQTLYVDMYTSRYYGGYTDDQHIVFLASPTDSGYFG